MTPFNLSHMAINAASINVDCSVRVQRCLSVSTRAILRQECKLCKRKEEINQEVLWRERISGLRAVYMPRLIDKITQQMKDLTLADE